MRSTAIDNGASPPARRAPQVPPHRRHRPQRRGGVLCGLGDALRWVRDDDPACTPELIEPLVETDYEAARWLAYQGLIARAARTWPVRPTCLDRPSRLESGDAIGPVPEDDGWLAAMAQYAADEDLGRGRRARARGASRCRGAGHAGGDSAQDSRRGTVTGEALRRSSTTAPTLGGHREAADGVAVPRPPTAWSPCRRDEVDPAVSWQAAGEAEHRD
jgi:hypothetical protein